MHWSLGNTQRGIVAGWIIAVLAALASAVGDEVSWQKTIAAILLISGPVLGALVDRGSAPAKE